MGWFDWMVRKRECATETKNYIDHMLSGGSLSGTGLHVTPTRAMQCAAVLGCVRVLSETVGQIPLHVYRRLPDGKERALDHPLYPVLHDTPNHLMSSSEFFEAATANICLRGNAFARINRVGSRVELLPMPTDQTEAKRHDNWTASYTDHRTRKTWRDDDVLHLRALADDGFYGKSPIQHTREAVALALNAERHGGRLFENGAFPRGVLTHPGKLSPEGVTRLSNSWAVNYGGENAHGTAVLEEGVTYQGLAMTNNDAQFLETRKYQRSEICGIFRVPPHFIGDLERATFSNIEHQSLDFVVYTILPYLRKFEQTINRTLIAPADRRRYFAEFDVDGLLRGDFKTRMEGYAIAIDRRIMNPNEVRAKENLNPYDGGDVYLTPLNMTAATPDGDDNAG